MNARLPFFCCPLIAATTISLIYFLAPSVVFAKSDNPCETLSSPIGHLPPPLKQAPTPALRPVTFEFTRPIPSNLWYQPKIQAREWSELYRRKCAEFRVDRTMKRYFRAAITTGALSTVGLIFVGVFFHRAQMSRIEKEKTVGDDEALNNGDFRFYENKEISESRNGAIALATSSVGYVLTGLLLHQAVDENAIGKNIFSLSCKRYLQV